MNRLASLILITALWAAIYLPWLGTPELRSEEGHRVLPAVEMLDRGDYLVPRIGGAPYLRKPPLINWIIAGAFQLTDTRNEWTARLPSAIAVLIVAVIFVALGARSFGLRTSRFAALAWLTSYGIIEKGRMIEIDAIYVSLFALAFISWLTLWHQRRSPWLVWTVPWIFLGLGMLAKGPAHLLFFYACVVAILCQTKRLRELTHPAHFIGLACMLAIFAAWAIPAFFAVSHGNISRTWWRELAMRVTGGENDATYWPMNFPRGVGYFLPWILLLPFVRVSQIEDSSRQTIARALRWGALVPFVFVLLLPGTIPRYVLPTIVPAAWLLAIALNDGVLVWNLRIRSRVIPIPSKAIQALVLLLTAAAAIAFPIRSATFLKHHPKVKIIAAKVNAALPHGETLYAVNPLFQPYLFYIRERVRYVDAFDQLPADARYFITLPTERAAVESSARWAPRRPRLILETPEYRGHQTLLFER